MGISKDRGSSCCICFIFFNMMFFALFALVAVAAADQAWEDYKLEFNKHYTAEEEPVRYANWKKDTEEVGLHNAMFGNDFTQAVNELSDLSDEEYKRLYLSSLLVPEGPSNATVYVPTNDAIPKDNVDLATPSVLLVPLKVHGRRTKEVFQVCPNNSMLIALVVMATMDVAEVGTNPAGGTPETPVVTWQNHLTATPHDKEGADSTEDKSSQLSAATTIPEQEVRTI